MSERADVIAWAGQSEAGRPWLRVIAPLPPTDNHLYVRRGRSTFLTTEGKRYDNMIKNAVGKCALQGAVFDPNKFHVMAIAVYFKTLLNKGWPKTAKRRIRKIDAHNRKKLIIDALTEAVGLDDSCLSITIEPKEDKKEPRIELVLAERRAQPF